MGWVFLVLFAALLSFFTEPPFFGGGGTPFTMDLFLLVPDGGGGTPPFTDALLGGDVEELMVCVVRDSC